ncbi:MAG: histidine--tRNA ligase [Candidatus Thermoplasmatota archaeon]|nr:histidine--tRNA ligase [Candidatus Thermoplasmatota archaeon]
MASIGKPRGTRDFTPEEMERRRRVETALREVFRRYGYREVATPTMEHLELFTLKSGEAIVEETYAFTDKSGRELALRPELTAPVMRFYVEQMQMEPKPLKLLYFGNCFRYDRPQAGRYREFWQMGCELIGTRTPEALAELIALAYHALRGAGLEDILLRVGDLAPLRALLDDMGVEDAAAIMRLIDKGDRSGVEGALAGRPGADTFLEYLDCAEVAALEDLVGKEQTSRLTGVLDWLSDMDTPARLDPSIARGLDYYTGIVFEIDAPALGAEKQLCGGGEYSLVPLLGGTETPTAGFALGFDRILLALEREGRAPEEKEPLVYVTPVGEDMLRPAARLAHRLRRQGLRVDMDLMRRSVSKSLQHAHRLGARHAVIVGADEWARDAVVVKNMASGEQREVAVKELAAVIW